MNGQQNGAEDNQAQDAGQNKNTVNINMNIMNIGLQGQLIGVNGPVQANHNVLNVGNMNGQGMNSKSMQNGGITQHKRSQSQAAKQP